MAKKNKVNFEKLHVLTWMITPAIIMGLHAIIIVIMQMNQVNMPCVHKNMVQYFSAQCAGQAPCIQSSLMIIGHAILRGAIIGGLFASIHNFFRKFFN